VFVGVLSYSLYLWQQLFLNRASTSWIERFPENLVLAFCAALVCHYAIERPFLKLRDAKRDSRAPVVAQPMEEAKLAASARSATLAADDEASPRGLVLEGPDSAVGNTAGVL
jgi:peptidoglycan/LPS O-acetylase OafA/YrhL